jgi:hypothetical protein
VPFKSLLRPIRFSLEIVGRNNGMAWTEVCKMQAVAQVDKRKEVSGSIRNALRELSKESGIPYGTLRNWYYQINGVPKIRNASKSDAAKETRKIADLRTLTFDSGRKKILFELGETDGNRLLAMQEYRVAAKGKETATKHRLIIPLDLFSQFREAMDRIEVMIKGGCSEEPEVVGSDHEEDDELEPPAGDDEGLAQDNAVDLNEGDKELSPAPADATEDTTVEAEFVQCADCVHFAVKKGAPEENGACNSRLGSWNGPVLQSPHEPHPCPNFHGEEHE